jgi:HK97 gp10 family phage protein
MVHMPDGLNIEGVSELEQKLRNLAPTQARKAFRDAGRKAAAIWVEAMRSRAPVLNQATAKSKTAVPGALMESIDASVRVSAANEQLQIHVGPAKGIIYGGFNEYGTRYMAAHPYARPAFMEHQDDILELFVSMLWDALKVLEQ